MAPRYKVTLTKEERSDLDAMSTKGKGLLVPFYMLEHCSCLMLESMVQSGSWRRFLKP